MTNFKVKNHTITLWLDDVEYKQVAKRCALLVMSAEELLMWALRELDPVFEQLEKGESDERKQ